MLLYKASIFNDNIEKLLKMTPQAVSSLGLGQISEYDDAHFHHSTQWPMIVKKKNTLTLPHPWLMPCKNWGAPELNDVGGSCKSFAACWKLKPPGRRRKSLAKPPICIVTSHFFCWKPHSILDPPSAGTPFQWSSLLQLLETSLWSFSGQNSCPCPDLLQLIYIIIPSLCIWIWPHHNWIRFLWSACNRGSSGLRISEFWGFQWQTLAEILSLFVKKVKLFFLKKAKYGYFYTLKVENHIFYWRKVLFCHFVFYPKYALLSRCDIRDSRMSQRNVSLTVSKCENFGPIFPIIKW